ncbi:hypothetical protein [Clostridium sp. BL-8]|uniref:hypothetical protein n=1 Tax=Clostridium sp. BL-8 TaxID=349938 RepID=UPI00098C194F|nr:hypothetical protein [Clostridium sp. BL-8]OOM69527.1 hypothetical protein CLOBL_52250 [Clostridium sp. BL-8]
MTLGRLLKWILVIFLSFIIGGLLAAFSKSNAILGYLVGIVWLSIAYFIILGYRLVPREKFHKLKEFEKLENINNDKYNVL